MIGMNSQDSYPGIQGAYITLLKGSPRQSDSHAMVWLLERNIWCGIILEKAPHLQQWNFWHMSLVGYVCLGSILSLANVYLRDLHSEDHKGSSSGTSFSRGETAWDKAISVGRHSVLMYHPKSSILLQRHISELTQRAFWHIDTLWNDSD